MTRRRMSLPVRSGGSVPDVVGFAPLDGVLPLQEAIRHRRPSVARARAADWPAVQKWSLAHLATLAPSMPVELVVGNREAGPTEFATSTLGEYLTLLSRRPETAERLPYLKEFDLLGRCPQLKADLRPKELLPKGALSSSRVWIGPTGARTGLHYDLLDNVAVQITGHKRFLLAAPGTVERAGHLSGKYDSWARLSAVAVMELAGEGAGGFFVVDLEPGDVLHVPARWWHEVVNLSPSVLLSGFYGPVARVLPRWAWVKTRDVLHRTRVLRAQECTCHPGLDRAA